MRSTDWSCAWVGSLFIYLVGVGFIGSRDGHGFFSLALLNFDPLGRWTLSLCFLFLGSYLDLLSTLYLSSYYYAGTRFATMGEDRNGGCSGFILLPLRGFCLQYSGSWVRSQISGSEYCN